MATTLNIKNAFNYVLLTTLLLKLALAALLPMSGDEAYFIVWARHLDFGYYDHPPMVGWFLHVLLYLGNSEWVMRLPAVLTASVIGYGIYRMLRPLGEDKAALVGILFLISPLNLLNVLITTDTPLILFAFLSLAALYRALQRDSLAWYALAGALLGMAFLSKYFAVLLGLAYLAYFLVFGRRQFGGFVLLVLAALPFALLNLYWNYTHCWDNILFNLYTRNEGAQFSLGKLAIFLGTQLYLLTPPVLYFLYRQREGAWQRLAQPQFKLFLLAFIVPLAVFSLLAMKKVVGLHWVLAFYPMAYLLLFVLLDESSLRKLVKFMAWFSAAHLALVAVLMLLPLQTWQGSKQYESLVFTVKTEALVQQLRPYEQQGFVLATDAYSPSAIISYHYGQEFAVFGEGGLHARQDDMITDYRSFNGRNILVLRKSAPQPGEYAPFFDQVEVKPLELHGATFYLVLGYSFNYTHYRDQVLRLIKDKYYRIPAWLPHAPCGFCERYFPGDIQPGRIEK